MGYQALLFCPDEKTARTVTQVLGELEFNVEACIEPFAAVKKLMSEHFDAVVVDCDNEQNATLLFKSARNSTSNQTSLAVAVVEGQAGVAKAFRIGANLVLTKPINIEQSKGTLRVARGLLRKGEPAKPGAATPAPAASAAPKPAAPKPAAPAKPAAPVAPAVTAAPRPAIRPAKPPVSAVQAATARAATPADDDILSEIIDPKPAPAPRPLVTGQAPSIELTSGFKNAPPAASASTFGSGAASAPAPAREAQDTHVAEKSSAGDDVLFDTPAEAPAEVSSAPVPTFTFGGANAPAESEGGSKKILIGIAAAVAVFVLVYAGWAFFHGRASQPASIQTQAPTAAAPATQEPAKPAPPKPTPTAPVTTAAPAVSQPSGAAAVPASKSNASDDSTAEGDDLSASPAPSKSTVKDASSDKSSAAPRVMKGGKVPALRASSATPDAPAPNLIGIATPGTSAPPPNLVGGPTEGPKPILQTLNISQGVSQGLVIKKVQPLYPQNALAMHVEGSVELSATISTSGSITAVKVVNGQPLLAKAAVDAVKQWKYKPYLLNGAPVEIQTQITINFKLPH